MFKFKFTLVRLILMQNSRKANAKPTIEEGANWINEG